MLLLVLVSKFLHEAGKSLHALEGHGVVDGRPHATNRAVALQLGLQQQAQQACPAHQLKCEASLGRLKPPPYTLLGRADTWVALKDQRSASLRAAGSLAAPGQQTAQQSPGSHSPQQPLGSSQVINLKQATCLSAHNIAVANPRESPTLVQLCSLCSPGPEQQPP